MPSESLHTFHNSNLSHGTFEDWSLLNVKLEMCSYRIGYMACFKRSKVSDSLQFRLLGSTSPSYLNKVIGFLLVKALGQYFAIDVKNYFQDIGSKHIIGG